MNIFTKSFDIWNSIEYKSQHSFQSRILIDEYYVGRNNNCLSAVAQAILLLDGKLNQLHFVKLKDEDIIHSVILMTPQPINQYSQIEISCTKQFVALIGCDTVGILDISNISHSKGCKKVKEFFKTQDEILFAKWYPQMHDCLAILTKQSINIYQCHPDMRIVICYQYYFNNDIGVHSKCFGIKDEFVTFDFGSSESGIDDNTILILTDSGDVLLLPELRKLINEADILPKKILFYPQSEDNYQDDFTSLIVLRGSLDLIVLVNCYGTLQHALLINENIYVYETINVSNITKDVECVPFLIADRHAHPPRYLLLHSNGIHSCVLPWVIRLRLAVQGKYETNINTVINEAGSAIIDHVIDTTPLSDIKQIPSKIHGVAIIREIMNPPKLFAFQYSTDKRLIRMNLRQESTLMTIDEDICNKVMNISGHSWPSNQDSSDAFLKAILSKLAHGRRIPCITATIDDNDDESDVKLALVLKVSEILAGDFGTRMEAAGEIFDRRMDQLKSIIELQEEQVNEIIGGTKKLQQKGKELKERFHKMSSRQKKLFQRLSECSNKFATMNNIIPRADREAVMKIKNVEKSLASMETLLRSCKFRFEHNESYIEEISKKKREINDSTLDVDKDKAQKFLLEEDEDIKKMVEDIRGLMN